MTTMYLVTVVDDFDFQRVGARQVFFNRLNAELWGNNEAEFRNKKLEDAGEPLFLRGWGSYTTPVEVGDLKPRENIDEQYG